jgi:hypothetical protein
MSPANIRFTAKVSRKQSCAGCLFIDQKAETCHAACAEAVKRGLPDCDDSKGYIYVEDVTDPRQIDLLGVQP